MEIGNPQAIADEIVNANFSRAVGLSEAWLRALPASTERTANAEKEAAEDAYEISRYFLHRQDRLSLLPLGRERGQLYEEILAHFIQTNSISVVRNAALMHCHAQIAENFARDFAGQKNYQLQLKDVLQLAYSLMMIANFASASEVLLFITTNYPTNASAHYFSAHAANMTGNETKFFEHYRQALYLKPEIVSEYPEFLPGGIFKDLFNLVKAEDYAAGVRERMYACLLEVNGVYRHRKKLKVDEARALDSEFRKLKQEYVAAKSQKKAYEPRLLQLLAMLVIHAHQTQNFEKFEEFRSEMIEIDHSIWQTFQQNNLTQGAP